MKSNFKFLLFSVFLILLSSADLEAQRKNRLIQKADKLFQSELYWDANELYKKGYKKTKNKASRLKYYLNKRNVTDLQVSLNRHLTYKKSIKASTITLIL